MQIGALSGADVALRILSRGMLAPGGGASGAQAAPSVAVLDLQSASNRTSNAALSAIQALGATDAGGADNIATVKTWAKLGQFQSAGRGVVDDQLRDLVKDGKLASLGALDEEQWSRLSSSEQNIYGLVRTLQGLYDGQPKSIEDALTRHVSQVLEGYPESIARMKEGVANGTLKEASWPDIIAGYESELAAAQQGRMQVHAVDDPKLVSATNAFTVHNDGVGWSGSGVTVHADIPALQALYGTQNVLPGSSPYAGSYVITW
ncbi:MAG: hypothetical protein NW223_08375 [Hyphomicrobiaceae bacterium]|nr:hypothetical protein [Hyphomicrobiaceae bacterium]